MATRHDPTKVVMGSVGSSDRMITKEDVDPATLPIGAGLRRTSTGALSLSSGDGILVGIHGGQSLSDTKKLALIRAGNLVPVKLTDEGVAAFLKVGDITFTAKNKGLAGNSITIALVDDAEAEAETVEVDGLDIIIHMADGESTAEDIAAVVLASEEAMALLGSVVVDEGDEAVAQNDASEAPLASGADSFPYAAPGKALRIHNTTGLAVSSSNTLTGAMFASGPLKGVLLDGSEIDVALVDMGGGL